ncbi:MAG: MarR family winged helix-turn-helix transcriptional regulator [Planctomycetota bacterium]|jgi:DNA-binding MarR family transcriptional regulator
MDTQTALEYVVEFLRLYWANEHEHEAWSRLLESQHGLTAKQYALLLAVHRSPQLTTTSLTDLLGKAQPAITQMLNRLDKNGFISRVASNVDKRKRDLVLTDKALDVLKTVQPIGPTRVAQAFEFATEREAKEVIKAMEVVKHWMVKRDINA